MQIERPSLPAVAGIFVGGASTRMGGHPKGLLVLPSGETIIAHLRHIFDSLAIRCVLVGAASKVANGDLAIVADDTSAEGPLGGVLALLEYARGRCAIAIACDMPHVSRDLVERLALADEGATIVAARREGRWEPFFARYDADIALPHARANAAAKRLSLQALFESCAARELTLTVAQQAQLRDWDTPEDIDRLGFSP